MTRLPGVVFDAICGAAAAGDADDVGVCDSRERQAVAAIATAMMTK
jgi:hypothetical protein